MNQNNLFIQRRLQVQRDAQTGHVHFAASIYIAYYFFLKNELYVSKYALCIKYTKSEAEIKNLLH